MPRSMKVVGHVILRELRAEVAEVGHHLTITHVYEALAAYHGYVNYAAWKHHGYVLSPVDQARGRARVMHRLAVLGYSQALAELIADAVVRHAQEP